MLKAMREYKSKSSVAVKYFSPTDDGTDLKEDLMYVTGYKEKMLADTQDGGIWNVSFNLEDLGNV